MRYISVFSGIEAASVAWELLGFEPIAFSEVDPFCNQLLAARFPAVPNLGDVKQIDWRPYHGEVDLVVGGSPCQAFSIAGGRAGLMDERGTPQRYYLTPKGCLGILRRAREHKKALPPALMAAFTRQAQAEASTNTTESKVA